MTTNSARLVLLVAVIVFFSSVLPDPTPAQTVSFVDARRDYATGSGPSSVAVSDFNGDGRPDLVIANVGFASVSVLLGNGDGTFQPAHNFAAGRSPIAVVVSDFNGDGTLDLAVGNGSSDVTSVYNISVLLGNGDGTFQQMHSIGSVPDSMESMAVGDFNGDGKSDLAVANGGSAVSVLLGNGDGTFQPAVTFTAGISPWSVAVGDFDSDGKQDLAVANLSSNNVSILLGNGDGTFRPALNSPAANYPKSVAVGDFNGDGIQDLAVADAGRISRAGSYPSGVSILLGTGMGTFLTQTFEVGTPSLSSIAVGDINGDKIQDLVVTDEGSNNVLVLSGNGDGTFQPVQTLMAGTAPSYVAIGDLNGDGKPDLAVTNLSDGNVSVLINNTTYIAHAPSTLTVTKAGRGTVRSTPSGIDCGATCSASYESGTVMTLTATPASGSIFTGWTGGCSGTGPCTVTLSGDTVVTATFDVQTFALTVTKKGPGSGTVTSSPAGIDCTASSSCSASYSSGTTVTLTATPDNDSRFTGWKGCDAASGTTCTVTLSAARSVMARFVGKPTRN